jgi:hypothetical protein
MSAPDLTAEFAQAVMSDGGESVPGSGARARGATTDARRRARREGAGRSEIGRAMRSTSRRTLMTRTRTDDDDDARF